MNNKTKFVQYLSRDVLPNLSRSPNYKIYVANDFKGLEDLISKLVNINFFEINEISKLDELLKQVKEHKEWSEYDKKNSSGIPHAIINKHYRNFLKLEEGKQLSNNNLNEEKYEGSGMKNFPLNLILYGPPGTGKTYHTIIKAMSIIDNAEYAEVDDKNYKALKEKFDAYREEKRIEFITFHQSYSYEDFVEGIKPNIEWGNASNELSYIGQDGIFKDICMRANKELIKQSYDIKEVSFDEVLEQFKELYPEKENFNKLRNLLYEKEYLKYTVGEQSRFRKIEFSKIEPLLKMNKEYTSSRDFYLDYGGNSSLSCYHYSFYKELLTIKRDLEFGQYPSLTKKNNVGNAKPYVLIIDEINRGDVSKIFGELITLIEEDKRLGNEHALLVTLPYSKEKFGVPKNLYIIGTMNTADRSIALLDTALRRRFDFVEMMPKPKLLQGIIGKENEKNNGINLEKLLTQINIRLTENFDRDHQIGHAYFININNTQELIAAYKNKLLPLLNEYFYNDADSVAKILNCTKGRIEKAVNDDDIVEILHQTEKQDSENE